MRTRANRDQASVNLALLSLLAAVALGVALYYWKFAPVDRQLIAKIVAFEVTKERDDARRPPFREAIAATVTFVNGGTEPETISKARFLASSHEDLSDPRSWSPTIHRDSMLLDLKIPAGQSITHTFIIPWTGREEIRYFRDDAPIYLGLEITGKTRDGAPLTRTEPFGHVIQHRGQILNSDHRLLTLDFLQE